MGYIEELRALVGTRPLILAGAGVIVVDDLGRVLLMRRTDNGAWTVPGGFMEPGEHPAETAARELEEESGLRLDPSSLSFFRFYAGAGQYYRYPNGDEVHNIAFLYVGTSPRTALRRDESESTELRFFDLAEVPEPVSPTIAPVIRDYAEYAASLPVGKSAVLCLREQQSQEPRDL